MTITISAKQAEVFKEVAQTTAYVGANINDNDSYDKISTDDGDESILARFWNESKFILSSKLKRIYDSETDLDGTYKLSLNVSNSYQESFSEELNKSLFSFLVANIVSKWFKFVNKEEAAQYAVEAQGYLDDIARKAFYKQRPNRPTYPKS